MNKDTKISFVGQPIFAQVLKLVNKNQFFELIEKNKSDRYYKKFKTWDHFVSLIFWNFKPLRFNFRDNRRNDRPFR